MFRRTIPRLRNFPLSRTAGPSLSKVKLPHQLPLDEKAEIVFDQTLSPSKVYYDSGITKPPPVVFGNRIKRKHQDKGVGRNEMSPILCIDLFTMLDTQPLAKVLAAEIQGEILPEKLQQIAELWRGLQVQYCWRLGSMDEYLPFSNIIPLALSDALTQHGLLEKLDEKAFNALTAAFLSLPTSSDVRPFLNSLSDNKSPSHSLCSNTYLHSNAPLSVMDALISSNPSTLQEFFYHPGKVRSVDTIAQTPKRYKPHPSAYAAFADEAGVKGADVILITSHMWDVVGAKKAGWRVAWVDRKGEGWSDGLGVGVCVKPDWSVASLEGMGEVFAQLR